MKAIVPVFTSQYVKDEKGTRHNLLANALYTYTESITKRASLMISTKVLATNTNSHLLIIFGSDFHCVPSIP
jgi:hypothetical protein